MNLFNVVLIVLSIMGLLLVVFGFSKISQLSIVFGGIVFLSPIFYLVEWTVFLPFVPVIALVISFLGKKKVRSD